MDKKVYINNLKNVDLRPKPIKINITEAVAPKEYAMLCRFRVLKGIFKKKPAGDYLVIAIKRKESFMMFQFMQYVNTNLYIVGFVDGEESPDEEHLESFLDDMRYHAQVEVLEDKLPIKIVSGKGLKLTFTRPSKYIGKSFELLSDSRLGDGYFMARCNIRKDYEPVVLYKVSSDIKVAKQMRSFTSSKIKSIMKK